MIPTLLLLLLLLLLPPTGSTTTGCTIDPTERTYKQKGQRSQSLHPSFDVD